MDWCPIPSFLITSNENEEDYRQILKKKKGIRDTYTLVAPSPEAEINPVIRHQFKQLYDIDLPEMGVGEDWYAQHDRSDDRRGGGLPSYVVRRIRALAG